MTPPQRLRRAATLTVENAGIHWLLINDNDGGAGDFRDRTAQWGITLTATGGKYRLYHLE